MEESQKKRKKKSKKKSCIKGKKGLEGEC